MLNARIPAMRNQAWIGVFIFGLALWLAWEIGGKIAAEDFRSIEFSALILVGCMAALAILRNWRDGFYFFLVWLLFEDLARKYMGNSLALFFGKDVLALLTYISLLVAIRQKKERAFRSPFLLFLGLFFWLGMAQVFNPN